MTISTQFKKYYIVTLLVIAISFNILAGDILNPLIIWDALPLYVGYAIFHKAFKAQCENKLYASIGFLIVSVGFSYFYHIAWFLDWEGTRTGGSTSALIFIWFPIYSVLIGSFGYFVGRYFK